MAESIKETGLCRRKVKTGCGTCRRCTSTGRSCDGYGSRFRPFNSPTPRKASLGDKAGGDTRIDLVLRYLRPTGSFELVVPDIDLLNRYFSIKTVFEVTLSCSEEAKQILQASMTDAPVRHAVLSLRALREDYEACGARPAYTAVAQRTPGHSFGIQQYNAALKLLASRLSCPGSNFSSDAVRSALLCCQIFISIEQVRRDHSAMAQHIIRGLRIMHEYRARPYLASEGSLMQTQHEPPLPSLDVFIIKMFAAPCRFCESPSTTPRKTVNTGSSACPLALKVENATGNQRLVRVVTPDTRTKLTRIATSILDFLDKVSGLRASSGAVELLTERAALLDSLKSWVHYLERVYGDSPVLGNSEPLTISFQRLFYQVLRIVLLGALESPSSRLLAELKVENDKLQAISDNLNDRVKEYYGQPSEV